MKPERLNTLLSRINNNDPTLTTIRLNVVTIEEESDPLSELEVAQLTEALKKNTQVKSLTFFCNPIGDIGVILVSKMLKENKSITSLTLDSTGMSTYGFEALFLALAENTSITKLNLNANHILSQAAPDFVAIGAYRAGITIANMLIHNKSLRELQLTHCYLQNITFLNMAKGLKKNKTLTSIDFRGNSIDTTGLTDFLKVITENHTLTKLINIEECARVKSREDNILLKDIAQQLQRNQLRAMPKNAYRVVSNSVCRLFSTFHSGKNHAKMQKTLNDAKPLKEKEKMNTRVIR